MSTFNGLVDEFPDIRIDYFRSHTGRRPPAACFLSHVHSDHLLGLESLKMPFVYCSSITRNMLLRLEKYPHRVNFQKGILESRKQTYRHLNRVLRALPLETPIELELRPRLTIRVTLFDANHCPGAVMFLIEGSGKAILYTGDIRAEPWWVNAIARNPILLPYCCGRKVLDCIYLDTTFASHENIYRDFPTKADGLKELLEKVDRCPAGSIFYFRAWTLGYEEVWTALANHLRTRVHVDDYQLRLYTSLSEDGAQQGAALVGVQVGNAIYPGCLSNDTTSAIHSCEKGMKCHMGLRADANTVWITPIISRTRDGTEVCEIGAGGGSGDLSQVAGLEVVDDAFVNALRAFCVSTFSDKDKTEKVELWLKSLRRSKSSNIALEGLGLNQDEQITLKDFLTLLSERSHALETPEHTSACTKSSSRKAIHFPYSRHSSLSELRDLVSRFNPRDICPCTVDEQMWSEHVSMKSLFGDVCSGIVFRYDDETRKKVANSTGLTEGSMTETKRKRAAEDSQETASQDSQQAELGCNLPGYIRRQGSRSNGHNTRQDIALERYEHVILISDDEEEFPGDGSCSNSCLVGRTDVSPSLRAVESPLCHEGQSVHERSRDKRERFLTRAQAYEAAKSYLSDNQPARRDGLKLRSCGWKGHTEDEVIL